MRLFFLLVSKVNKLLFTAFLLVGLVSTSVFSSPYSGSQLPDLIPKADERSLTNPSFVLGHHWFRKISSSPGLIDFPPAYDYLRLKLAELTPYSQLTNKMVDIALLNSRQTNAFVIPGNHLFIYSDILALIDQEDSLMGLLAHELAHLELSHYERGQQQRANEQRQALALMLAGIFAAANGSAEAGTSIAIGGAANQASNLLSYSRDHEREADRRGRELLRMAGKAPSGMTRLLLGLSAQSQANPDLEFLYTHPLPLSRAADQLTPEDSRIMSQPSFAANSDAHFRYFRATLLAYRAALVDNPESYLKSHVTSPDSQHFALALLALLLDQIEKSQQHLDQITSENEFTSYLQLQVWLQSQQELRAKTWLTRQLQIAPNNLTMTTLLHLIQPGLPYIAATTEAYRYQIEQRLQGNLVAARNNNDEAMLYTIKAEQAYWNGNTELALRYLQDALNVDSSHYRSLELRSQYEKMKGLEIDQALFN